MTFIRKTTDNQRGFSIIGLLISIALSSLLLVGVFNIYSVQNKTFIAQDQVIEMQENVRAAMDIMVRDIRMTGYDPTGAGSIGIVFVDDALPSLQFSADINENGVIGADEADEDITYSYDSGSLEIKRKGFTNDIFRPLVGNIENLTFNYYDASGTLLPSPVNIAEIRSVEISITVRAGNSDPYYGSNSGYRTRTLTSRAYLRNLGL